MLEWRGGLVFLWAGQCSLGGSFLYLGVLLIGMPLPASPSEVVTGSGDDSTSIRHRSTPALVLISSG